MRKRGLSCLLLLILWGCVSPSGQQEHVPARSAKTAALAATDCNKIRQSATWNNTNLFDLTYRCLPKGWEAFFDTPAAKAEVKRISDHLQDEARNGGEINPDIGNTFRALYETTPSQIRAVIVGQDPAPMKGEATGLSFSLKPGTSANVVPSVQRVMLEAENEGYCMNLSDGDLSSWAHKGVLLLNMALTIPCKKDSKACSIAGHLPLWDEFSGSLVGHIEKQPSTISYILWGRVASQYAQAVRNPKHRVFMGGHPSPQAAGDKFFCGNYFACTNKWLQDHGDSIISWDTKSQCSLPQSCVWSKGI